MTEHATFKFMESESLIFGNIHPTASDLTERGIALMRLARSTIPGLGRASNRWNSGVLDLTPTPMDRK